MLDPDAPSPFLLPPGPERRAKLTEQGYNISLTDYTEAELAEGRQFSAEVDAVFAARKSH